MITSQKVETVVKEGGSVLTEGLRRTRDTRSEPVRRFSFEGSGLGYYRVGDAPMVRV